MASQFASMKPSQGSSGVTFKPIDILHSQYATIYSNLHPVLLLSLAIFSFPPLVADPASTLLGLAPTVTGLQFAYCVLCLPAAGQAPSQPPSKTGTPKKNPNKQQQLGISFKIVPAILALTLTLALSTPLLYLLLLAFGAPLTTHHVSTVLLALHLALLTTPQLFYVHGLEKATWLCVASLQLPLDEVYGMSLGACFGAWVGAVPIPLDWDREWQRWPVTVVLGVYAGAVLGKVLGGWVVKGRRVKMG
ncbi:hypothetical protein MBLNU230_g6680t1 [Neophaeotheca triangularis]